jgi:hypothetical protein
MYREYFYCVDRVHDSALHREWCTACCEAHTNFSDESACLVADNIWNKLVTVHTTQEVVENALLFTHIYTIFFAINCLVKTTFGIN